MGNGPVPRWLRSGVAASKTAIPQVYGVRMAIDAGYFPGPRMFVTVSALSQTGGHTDSHFMCGADLDVPLPDRPYMVVDGVEIGEVEGITKGGTEPAQGLRCQ